ncbi:MAG: RidA family protein [Chitinophagales bacterium]
MKKIIYTNKAPAPIGPYSQATEAGGFIFVSGQIAIDPETGNLLQVDDIKAETHLVMQNLQAIVTSAGCTMQDVVKCTIFLMDMQQFPEVNNVYGTYFQTNPPARETVQVSALPKGVHVEISAIVWKN